MYRFSVILRPLLAAVALVATLAALSQPTNATMMSPFGDEISDLTGGDLALLKTSAHQVLERNIAGTVSSWTNDETGHYGFTVLIRTFKRDGVHCGAVAHGLIAGGRARFVLPYCKVDNGVWRIMF